MSALFPSTFSAPAQRVEAITDHGTERFSRTLDQRNPYSRSSTVQIVPMGGDAPMHPAERLVLSVSAAIGLLLIVALLVERFTT